MAHYVFDLRDVISVESIVDLVDRDVATGRYYEMKVGVTWY